MTLDITTPTPARFERTYDGPVDDLWDLWTTKDGFESWWGPEGFRVEVSVLDARVGGALVYDMIASGAEQVAAMKSMNMPLSHPTHGAFAEVVPKSRLVLRHRIDFVPNVAPYDNDILVEFLTEGARVRMVVTIQPHSTAHWTRMSAQGFESQLSKLPGALAGRRGATTTR